VPPDDALRGEEYLGQARQEREQGAPSETERLPVGEVAQIGLELIDRGAVQDARRHVVYDSRSRQSKESLGAPIPSCILAHALRFLPGKAGAPVLDDEIAHPDVLGADHIRIEREEPVGPYELRGCELDELLLHPSRHPRIEPKLGDDGQLGNEPVPAIADPNLEGSQVRVWYDDVDRAKVGEEPLQGGVENLEAPVVGEDQRQNALESRFWVPHHSTILRMRAKWSAGDGSVAPFRTGRCRRSPHGPGRLGTGKADAKVSPPDPQSAEDDAAFAQRLL
jgi:hypothetical protein